MADVTAPSLVSLNSQKVGSKFTLERVEEPDVLETPLPQPNAQQLWGRCRYLILLLAVFCFTAARSNDLVFAFTIICMTNNNSESGALTIPFAPQDLSLSFAGAGAGAIIAALPLAFLLQIFGGRMVMSVLLLLSAIGTCFIPYAATFALEHALPISTLIFPLRIIQGIGVASVMPMMGFVSAHWAPVTEIGKFVTILSSASQLSQIVTMPASAHLCVTTGWPWAYYLHGIIAISGALLFLIMFRNSPNKHPCVSESELTKITNGVQHRKRKDQCIPYRSIATSKPIWAVWLAFLGNSFGFQLIVQFMPTYLNKVLQVPIERTGFSAVLPPITQLLIKILAGYCSDKITFLAERRKLQVFNTIAMCGCALFLLPLGFLDRSQASLAIVCFSSSISCLGLVTCGSMKSATMVARQYSHFVMSIVQFVVCIGMLGVPFLVSTLAPNNTIEEWRNVVLLVGMILSVCNLGFCLLCDSEPAKWTIDNIRIPSTKNIPLLSDDPQATVATIAELA
ncbi:unnamed protein product [Auanema sp. JU1783]|nr:unnamed protein product [Auanema sp. JU1783]